MIFSGRTPSFPVLKFKLFPANWIEFNYIHGWLVSEVIDSSKIYVPNEYPRAFYYPKYISSNLFSFQPFKGLYFSLGNSIIY